MDFCFRGLDPNKRRCLVKATQAPSREKAASCLETIYSYELLDDVEEGLLSEEERTAMIGLPYTDAPRVSMRPATPEEFREHYERNLNPSYVARKQVAVQTPEG